MKVHLIDGSFFPRERSATLAGDNSGLGPESFEWTDEPIGGVTFYTDVCLEQALGAPGRKVAWLLEPPWKRAAYETAWKLREHFDYVLTYTPGYFSGKHLLYSLGGSWIKQEDWGVYPKSKMVSMIASEKDEAPGHRLRHEIVHHFAYRLRFDLDIMGRGYRPIESKTEGLRDYRYSIVIESCRTDGYFSEKLIDCLSQGTVPIYWGCPGIRKWFNPSGVIQFKTLSDLSGILRSVVSEADYESRLPAIRDNLERARRYRCAEDWIFGRHRFLFEGDA